MAKIYMGDKILIKLDCKEDVDLQSDLYIYHKKPESEVVGLWPATGNGNFAEYETVKDVDLDEEGQWEVQPWSDTFDVHGDKVIMPVFPPLVPFRKDSKTAYMVGV